MLGQDPHSHGAAGDDHIADKSGDYGPVKPCTVGGVCDGSDGEEGEERPPSPSVSVIGRPTPKAGERHQLRSTSQGVPCSASTVATSSGHRDAMSGSVSAGFATLAGLSLHSAIEGAAAGSSPEEASLLVLVFAIVAHKGFAAFALGSALLPLTRPPRERRTLWLGLVVFFALTGSGGVLLGAFAGAELGGQGAAALTCLAAGTLLSVGFLEMLLPALQQRPRRVRNFVGAAAAALLTTLLAAWA
eukprot:gnl/TRDRNA2_/TRDRNA2_86607_c0_seq1.p1 gnl/TRDRNA2_/TRDRNA2_86607_c0~~gnl/TRDRNA2_/TRDRNA2_86607_c0_seq1.p1  ORF type:complete len:245 (+),score=37.67 gnl/TRDRNA2_/TRDRNA2_86607_c0_seq1:75-809(+)